MNLNVRLGERAYDIIIERGVLSRASTELRLDRRVLIVTDNGVPQRYVDEVARQCLNPHVVTVAQGEASKSLTSFELLCRTMLEKRFGRGDCVVAVGGGMVGDLAGFAAASYMRGIDFYNIPTTLLSQVDSSIGGKTAVNLGGIKNIVGAFYQPKKVLIDPDTLSTLTPRLFSEGLAEVIKMAACDDEELFSLLETQSASEHIEKILVGALHIKRRYVENDEKEVGERAVLNFGHTVGHAVEAGGGFYHGECVAIGMLYFCGEETRARLRAVLEKYNLPTRTDETVDTLFERLCHDKKANSGTIRVVYVDKIGTHRLENLTFDDMKELLSQTV